MPLTEVLIEPLEETNTEGVVDSRLGLSRMMYIRSIVQKRLSLQSLCVCTAVGVREFPLLWSHPLFTVSLLNLTCRHDGALYLATHTDE